LSSDPLLGTRNAINAGTALLERGYAPYVPHLTCYWHIVAPQEYETWMALDFAYLAVCDVLLRLPGPSNGSDREVAEAKRLGIPVYYSLDTLIAGVSSTKVESEYPLYYWSVGCDELPRRVDNDAPLYIDHSAEKKA
jgi:hypothetical protein